MMGKRKRKDDSNKTPPPPDITPFAPQEVLQLDKKSYDQAESSGTQSNMDIMGSSIKRPTGRQSRLNQDHSSSRAILLRRGSRQPFGRHYHPKRSSTSNSDASPSNWTSYFAHDAELSFKLASKDDYDLHNRESFHKPERISSSSSLLNAAYGNTHKIGCGLCQKRLMKKPVIMENSISSSLDLSVVAVLVCGHAYHADCLEQKTTKEDLQDPPCPFCV